MFQEKRLMMMYTVSPVHMGCGTSLGVIDNPIQRERHTSHPVFAGSGIKGAAREQTKGNGMSKEKINKIFGPDTNASDHAGAVSFADAQIVAFPVRSLKEGYIYATSPMALARLARLAQMAGTGFPTEMPPQPAETEAVVPDENGLLSDGKLVLESYEFSPSDKEASKSLKGIGKWLAQNAMPDSPAYFRDKIEKHLVLLSETQFTYFVNNATVVEPHVKINDITGTATEGGLFFTENVPPESLFVSLVMASQERKKKGANGDSLEAKDVMERLTTSFDKRIFQLGGDATTGRGQVFVKFVGNAIGKEA